MDQLKNNKFMTLGEIKGGAAIEMANLELRKIYDDIVDPNKDGGSQRKLSIEVVFAPNEDARAGACFIRVKSSLGKMKEVKTTVFFGYEEGHGVCTEFNRDQLDMFPVTTEVEN